MSYYDGFDKEYFPCGESYFDKQQFDGYDNKDCECGKYEKKYDGGCYIEKKFPINISMECELKCRPCAPKPVCPPKPKCYPVMGCFCFKTPPRKDFW